MRDTKSLKSRFEYAGCGIRRAGKADSSKRDARYEEREGQMRVNEMRDTKSGRDR